VRACVCVSGKTWIIVGNKLIGNQSPFRSVELVALDFKNEASEGRRANPRLSSPFLRPHTGVYSEVSGLAAWSENCKW
jgi:hypothetical protein